MNHTYPVIGVVYELKIGSGKLTLRGLARFSLVRLKG
jgi:hypothetical protein